MRGPAVAAGVITALICLAGMRAFVPEPTWESVRGHLAREFPDIPRASPGEILHRLATAAERGLTLTIVDVRTPDEYAVSHIPTARRMEPGSAPPVDLPPGPIITYCSVGYRSNAFARRLTQQGREVTEIDGGIFAWAEAGLPLVDASGHAVAVVHPFDPYWGRLLPEELRAQVGGSSHSKAPSSHDNPRPPRANTNAASWP